MARKQTTPAKGSPEISQEKLQALEIAPELLPQGMAVVRQQSDVKGAEEIPTAHPMPAGPAEFEECDRMLASAESLDEKKVFFHKQLARQKLLGEIEARRASFWSMEPLTLPRASMCGRYLNDERINENRKHIHVHEQVVYGELFKRAPHHLSEAAKKHVKCAQAPTAPSESRAAASYFIKDLKRRIDLLFRQKFLERDGNRFWLNTLGARVFNRWPWWTSRNDDEEPQRDSEPPDPPTTGKRKTS
jgi:hypothetical protein